jgi:RHS repeat-associated protein
VYLGGESLAEYKSGSTFFIHPDHLGSARLVTNVGGGVYDSLDYLPFGEQIRGGTGTTHKFTGKERDAESGLDNFGARYDSSQYGRFMSPDPSMAFSIRQINPQRWNQYAYAVNNPLSYTDPTGQDAIAVNFSGMVAGLGHEGIISVHSDGSSSYARFGPTNHGLGNVFGAYGRGEIQQTGDLPKLQFDGVAPTPASLNALLQSVAKIEGVDPSTVRINYFKTSEADTIMMDNAITQTAQAAATGSGPFCLYSVASNNCSSFTLAGLLWGNAITSAQAKGLSSWQSTDPNALFGGLSGLSLFNIDEFDLMQLQNPPRACVSTDDGLGNTSSTCY